MKMLEIIETETDFSVVDDTPREPEHELVQARKQNAKLQNALREARDEIAALREEVDKLCAPPSTYEVYLSANEDDTVDVLAHGRKVKVRLRIVYVKSLVGRASHPQQNVEKGVNTGQYLSGWRRPCGARREARCSRPSACSS